MQQIRLLFEDIPFVLVDGFDDCIIGVESREQRLVYDANKMVEKIMEKEGWVYFEAADWFEYNIESVPHGEHTPIYVWTRF